MKEYFSPWMIAGSILLASLLVGALFLWIDFNPPPSSPSYEGEAALTVIPRPSSTPTRIVMETSSTPSPTAGEEIRVNGYVKIEGTGGDGLRLRAEPSLSGDINYLGLEDEVFHVLDGPVDQDGYVWWLLEAPANPGRNGWAVSNYLEADQPPQE